MDVMLDLETLGTRPDAAIIQIGAVLFEPFSGGKVLNGKGFMRHVLVQDGAGSVDHATIAWWLLEASAAKMGKALADRAVTLADALEDFLRWPTRAHELSWEAITGIWAKPATFDLPIMSSAYAALGHRPPWDRRATKCAQTLFALAGGRPDIDLTGLTPHDALDDAVGQAQQVQAAMGVLGIGRR